MSGQSGDARSIRSIRRSRIVELRKPLVKWVTVSNSADTPHGIANIRARSAECNIVTDLTESLRSRVVELHKPWVKSVRWLNSANLAHGVANIGERSVKYNSVTDLTEGLRSRIVELRKPSVRPVTMLNSADLRMESLSLAEGLRNSAVLPI